jgi:transitional endoplasmic reticulum ATPase
MVERRVLVHLFALLDALREEGVGAVFVLATTSRLSALDAGLRAGHRLSHELELASLTTAGRLDMLRLCCRGFSTIEPLSVQAKASFEGDEDKENAKIAKDGEEARELTLRRIAMLTRGYVGADLEAVCREGALLSIQRPRRGEHDDEGTKVFEADLVLACKQRRPAHLRTLAGGEAAGVTFASLAGVGDVVARIQGLLMQEVNAEQQRRRVCLGVTAVNGVLLCVFNFLHNTYTRARTCTHTHTHIHAYIHTYIHANIHTCKHTCIHTYIHTYMRT